MTTPIYTATAGPADPKAGAREIIYRAGTILLGVVGLATAVFGVSKGVGNGLELIINGVLMIAGAGPTALAARKTAEQRQNGTFDPAPVVEQSSTDTLAQGLQKVQGEINATVAGVTDGLQQIGAIAAAVVPGLSAVVPNLDQSPLGPLATQILGAGR